MLTALIACVSLATLGLGAVLMVPILSKLYRRCRVEDVSPEWLESFSPSIYYPMQGLLADEDFRFLSRQPGFDLSLYRKLRRERLNIFRQYLVRLVLDFNRLHAVARMLIAHGSVDRSDLLGRMIRLKIRFTLAVFQAELSYTLCCFGFRSLAARAMILRLEEMSVHLGSLSAGGQSALTV